MQPRPTTKIFAYIVGLLLTVATLAILNGAWIDELNLQQLLATRMTRDIGLGKNVTATDPYRETPLAVDFVLDGDEPFSAAIYEIDINADQRPNNEASETFRVFLAKSGQLTVSYDLELQDLQRTPRTYIYDDTSNMLEPGTPVTAEVDTNRGLSAHTVNFKLEPGLYKIKNLFNRQQVNRISMSFNPVRGKNKLRYERFVHKNLKTVHFNFLPGQEARLGEIRQAQKMNWSRLKAGAWSERFLPSPKEAIQASVRSENGNWAVAEIALSGRNSQHHSKEGLPSIDVRVRAGELPYGLRRFKLYVLKSKSFGFDMMMEQLAGDMGVPMYRQDIVRVVVNGEPFGFMQLWESADSHFFEYAQVTEGAVVGYDTDSIIANRGHSWFQPKSYHKRKTFPYTDVTDIGSKTTAEKFCPNSMGNILSFGLFYSGMHGLGNDTRLYYNSRLNCVSPLYKDINAGVLRLHASKDHLPKRWGLHPTYKGLTALSIVTPMWRPFTPSYASYFVYRRPDKGDRQQGFFWWTVIPPVMNYSNVPEFDSDFRLALNRLHNPAHNARFASRLKNFLRAAKFLNLKDQGASKIRAPKAYMTLAETVTWQDWEEFFNVPKSCDDSYIRKIIANSGPSGIAPDCRELHRLNWRNKILYGWAKDRDYMEFFTQGDINMFDQIITEQNTSFLFQTDAGDFFNIYFIQRICGDNCSGKFWLEDDETGDKIYPNNMAEFGSREVPLTRTDLFLNDIQDDEKVRVLEFAIPKLDRYQHFIPQYKGTGYYFGSHGLAIPPATSHTSSNTDSIELSQFFHQSGNILTWKDNASIPRNRITIPEHLVWKVETPTKIRFGQGGCLEIRGNLDISQAGNLELTDAGAGWDGIHFLENPDLSLRNLTVKNAGTKQEFVHCGDRKYTGAVSIFSSFAEIENLLIEDNTSEDALHVLRSHILMKNSSISRTRSDAIDSDYSVVSFTKLDIADAGILSDEGGDAVDFSGSYAALNDVILARSSDKNISLGENSNITVSNSTLEGGLFGIAIKDASRLEIADTVISDTPLGIALYSKKPYYPYPKFKFPENEITFVRVNRHFDQIEAPE